MSSFGNILNRIIYILRKQVIDMRLIIYTYLILHVIYANITYAKWHKIMKKHTSFALLIGYMNVILVNCAV